MIFFTNDITELKKLINKYKEKIEKEKEKIDNNKNDFSFYKPTPILCMHDNGQSEYHNCLAMINYYEICIKEIENEIKKLTKKGWQMSALLLYYNQKRKGEQNNDK